MREKWIRRLRPCLLLMALAVMMLAGCGGPSFRGSVLEEPVSVPDLELTDQLGQPFQLSEQQGQVVLLFFGYTSCPDVCPTTLATWRRIHDALGKDAERVRFVFVTVDPERDTPARLGLHVNAFHPEFVGLTGTQGALESLYDFFAIYRERDTSSGSALGYLVNHTATTFILDTEGRWRLRETYGTPDEDIVHDIQQLLE